MSRNDEIYKLKKQGYTNARIGAIYGLSTKRISRICKAKHEEELVTNTACMAKTTNL